MTLILCIETGTEVCSVAIGINGNCLIEETLYENKRHSSMLTSMIKKCLDDSGIDFKELTAVAISDGPGSYTGLRVGASTAKGICFALGIPLIAISSLKALAYPQVSDRRVQIISTIDARRMESYVAHWDNELNPLVPAYSLIWEQESIDRIFDPPINTIICGTGIEKAMNIIRFPEQVIIRPSKCSASNLCSLAELKYSRNELASTAFYAPAYLKSPNITEPSPKALI